MTAHISSAAYLDQTFSDIGTGERLIFGVSDNVPPDASLPRLERIKERIRAFGPVDPKQSWARLGYQSLLPRNPAVAPAPLKR